MRARFELCVENTPENVDFLKEIGYKVDFDIYDNPNYHNKFLMTYHDMSIRTCSESFIEWMGGNIGRPMVDCTGNSLFFKAIAAMISGTDRWQWFIEEEGELLLCVKDEFVDMTISNPLFSRWFKCTLAELKRMFIKTTITSVEQCKMKFNIDLLTT